MNVAHCIHGVGLGGAQQIVKFIVGASDPETFHYRVYCSLGGVRREEIEAAGATVRVLPRHLPKFDPFWIRALARAMRRDRIDVVHTHLFGDSLHGYLAARWAGLPVVMTLHNTAVSRTRLQLAGYRWLLRRVEMPVACAEFVRQSFAEHAGEHFERILAIPNGIAAPSLPSRPASRRALVERVGVREDAVVLACLGRMVEQKGYPYLLDAMARLDDTPAQLVMFGEGPLRGELEAHAAELGLGERVLFAGFRSDIPELLPGIDVVVFSSLWEGLPVALLEAMAAERCLVATAVGGIPEAVDDDHQALLMAPRDVEALAAALRRASADGQLRQRLGEAARRRFEDRFTVERMASAYETLYRRLHGDRRST